MAERNFAQNQLLEYQRSVEDFNRTNTDYQNRLSQQQQVANARRADLQASETALAGSRRNISGSNRGVFTYRTKVTGRAQSEVDRYNTLAVEAQEVLNRKKSDTESAYKNYLNQYELERKQFEDQQKLELEVSGRGAALSGQRNKALETSRKSLQSFLPYLDPVFGKQLLEYEKQSKNPLFGASVISSSKMIPIEFNPPGLKVSETDLKKSTDIRTFSNRPIDIREDFISSPINLAVETAFPLVTSFSLGIEQKIQEAGEFGGGVLYTQSQRQPVPIFLLPQFLQGPSLALATSDYLVKGDKGFTQQQKNELETAKGVGRVTAEFGSRFIPGPIGAARTIQSAFAVRTKEELALNIGTGVVIGSVVGVIGKGGQIAQAFLGQENILIKGGNYLTQKAVPIYFVGTTAFELPKAIESREESRRLSAAFGGFTLGSKVPTYIGQQLRPLGSLLLPKSARIPETEIFTKESLQAVKEGRAVYPQVKTSTSTDEIANRVYGELKRGTQTGKESEVVISATTYNFPQRFTVTQASPVEGSGMFFGSQQDPPSAFLRLGRIDFGTPSITGTIQPSVPQLIITPQRVQRIPKEFKGSLEDATGFLLGTKGSVPTTTGQQFVSPMVEVKGKTEIEAILPAGTKERQQLTTFIGKILGYEKFTTLEYPGFLGIPRRTVIPLKAFDVSPGLTPIITSETFKQPKDSSLSTISENKLENLSSKEQVVQKYLPEIRKLAFEDKLTQYQNISSTSGKGVEGFAKQKALEIGIRENLRQKFPELKKVESEFKIPKNLQEGKDYLVSSDLSNTGIAFNAEGKIILNQNYAKLQTPFEKNVTLAHESYHIYLAKNFPQLTSVQEEALVSARFSEPMGTYVRLRNLTNPTLPKIEFQQSKSSRGLTSFVSSESRISSEPFGVQLGFSLFSVPSRPSVTSVPSVPSRPSFPSTPSSPSRLSQPSIPSVPSIPSFPSFPSIPSTPSFPSIPSTPSSPSQISVPSIPSIPSVPSIPSSPSSSGFSSSGSSGFQTGVPFQFGEPEFGRIGRTEVGFDVFVRTKGKFQKLNLKSSSLNLRDAQTFGEQVVDQALEKSFTLKRSNKPITPLKGLQAIDYKFRNQSRKGKINRAIFVEKNEFGLDTRTEVRKIQAARIAAQLRQNIQPLTNVAEKLTAARSAVRKANINRNQSMKRIQNSLSKMGFIGKKIRVL